MFARLFAHAGLSLDRLRALVEVGAAGGITRAAAMDPIRQSQYSRQIKELEDFFQTKLVERQGRGVRLTPGGRELARISRFFLLGLASFQRGCLAEERTFRIGASATFLDCFLVPVLARPADPPGPRYELATVGDLEIERRLHDLTLDFGVVTTATLSRPLQQRGLGTWPLCLWVPKTLGTSEAQARQALKERRLPLALAVGESALAGLARFRDAEPRLSCPSFLAAQAALERGGVAALLPDFLVPRVPPGSCWRVTGATLDAPELEYRLAWNPRLARLNPHMARRREWLLESLTARMRERHRERATR